jgi:hypothetical protein
MKQIVAILTLVFAIQTSQAQTYYARQAVAGTYSSYYGKFIWDAPNHETIRFTVQGNTIHVDNKLGWVFTVSSKLQDFVDSDGGHEVEFQAADQNGTDCIFKWITYGDGSMLAYVQYSNYAFKYIFS